MAVVLPRTHIDKFVKTLIYTVIVIVVVTMFRGVVPAWRLRLSCRENLPVSPRIGRRFLRRSVTGPARNAGAPYFLNFSA